MLNEIKGEYMLSEQQRQWRLIYDTPTFGARNMAIDEAILLSVSEGQALPTLRVYGWLPLCLSLGYGQRMSEVNTNGLEQRGWQIVRRPTGGKAILHGDELTYSVALPHDHDLAQGDVVESYRRISEALLTALRLLGLRPASEKQAKGTTTLGPVCFEVPSHYEITAGGRKLIGSAQVRRKAGILQHGTVPLYGDIARICDALVYDDETARSNSKVQVRERATTLGAVLGRDIHWDEAADQLIAGFRETFGIEFTAGCLTPAEEETAENLLQTVYLNPEWLYKR
jgi:lipoate-protein ligase A